MEYDRIEAANREVLRIAKSNYNKLYYSIRDLAETRKDEEIKILLLPKLLDSMLQREKDHVKRFHLQFLRDCFYLWLGSKYSDPSLNTLYYPYHMILAYPQGREAHERHLRNFLNDKARQVIENRLRQRQLFTNRREYFDYTQVSSSDWHSAAHQNTPVEHDKLDSGTINIPQFQALGDYSLGGLIKGYTMPARAGGHYICISRADSFVNDSFDFNKAIQWLGSWDFENNDFYNARPFMTTLWNHSFRNFAATYGYGRDFRIVSPLYEIPKNEIDFVGKEVIDGDLCWRVRQ